LLSGGLLKNRVVLKILGLTKSFGDLVAVNGLSLEVYSGEVFGLLGPNGAGKTTTINLISGLLKPDAGEVYLQGEKLTPGEVGIRKKIGICPQENVLWKRLTPFEQLNFLGSMYDLKPSLIRQRSRDLLDALGLDDSADKQAGTLSGGMQRRLNIALALIHDPEILILDEPEAGLDPQSRLGVREYVKSLAKEKTVLLTTHNMDEADRMSDRVAILDHGELLVLDTPEALKQTVGEGDVLEIYLRESFPEIEKLLAFLDGQAEILIVENLLQIRALDLVNNLQYILNRLSDVGIQSEDIRLRKNTLEDVFIQLTGRRLRE
jgi:ABC-2 type transport system ATP-binding protein